MTVPARLRRQFQQYLENAASSVRPQFDNSISPAGYVAAKDGSTVKIMDASTGAIKYEGSDAAAEMNKALSDLGDNGGGTLYIKAGEYLITYQGGETRHIPEIRMPDYTRVVGEGKGTKLLAEPNFGSDNLGDQLRVIGNEDMSGNPRGQHIEISNLRVDGNASNGTWAIGPMLGAVDYGTMCNVIAEDCASVPIYVSSSDFSSVINSEAHGGGAQGANGLYLDDGTHCRVVGNRCENNQKGVVLRSSQDTTCVANQVISSDDDGIEASEDTEGSTIQGNVVQSAGANGFSINNAYKCSIAGNVSFKSGAYGIRVESPDNGDGNSVVSNISFENQRHGIYVTGHDNNVIMGNICVDNSQAGAGSYDGISLHDTSDGDSPTDNIIALNRCYDEQASKTQQYGIRLQGGADANLIVANIVTGNLTGGITGAGASSVVRYNLGHVTENSGNESVSDTGTIAHGLDETPSYVDLTASADGHIAVATAVDGTNITVGLHDDAGSAVTAAETVYWEARA